MIEPTPTIAQDNIRKGLVLATFDEGLITIKECNKSYLYWDKVKNKKLPKGYTSIDLWAAVKATRMFESKFLRFGKYKFQFSQTDFIQEVLHEFDLNIGGNLGAQKLIPEKEKDRYLISSIMEEAIASSQMEGAVTTGKKAKEMLRRESKPKSKSDQMILNNYRTIKFIVDHKSGELTPEGLLAIHRLMTKATLDDPEGEGAFRQDDDVHMVDQVESEIVHTPPPYKEISKLIKEVCEFFNHDSQGFFIHPFVDGNGRTDRALFYWYLLSKGYWLTEYLSISRLILKSKTQYEKAYLYTENDDNDLTYFSSYNLKTMKLSFEALRQYIRKKLDEKKYITNFQRIPFINERMAEILKWYYDEPDLALTVKEVENRLLIANQTARNDLEFLVNLKLLEMLPANRKKMMFIRRENFET